MVNHNYNPRYDPLLDKIPGTGDDYAPTYWVASADLNSVNDGSLTTDIEADVAIVGAGFTGLCTALFLAREYNVKAVVLEANQVAWGCSSRNGGQAQLSTGRLTRTQWIQKYGIDTAKNLHNEICEGMDTFYSLIKDENIQCDSTEKGHLYVAHKKSSLQNLIKQSEINNTVFNYQTRIINQETLFNKYVKENNAFGALLEPVGMGVHPVKLAMGYAKSARKYGAKIYISSPVVGHEEKNGKQVLITPQAKVCVKSMVITTGGYTHASLHDTVAYRYLPVLSNSIVTRVLTDEEIKGCGFQTNKVITDTRILRFYYRLLPDNRIQIGTRSAINGRDADAKKHYNLLVEGLYSKFPVIRGIKIDYSWWGWVDVSHDMMPRIVQSENPSIFYAFGYGGNGVSFSAQAGKRLSELITGNFNTKLKNLPIYNSYLPTHPFRPFRRVGQKLAYYYYHTLDLLP